MGISGKIKNALKQICDETLIGGDSLRKPGDGKGCGVDKTECDHDEHDHKK